MFIPQGLDLIAVIGGTFDPTFTFYTDVAETSPLNLTGYGALLSIGAGLFALTPGSGLTLGGAAGTVAVKLTAAETGSVPSSAQHWWLQLTDGAGNVGFPLRGSINFIAP